MDVEKHSRWEKYPRKADLIRDLRVFYNHLESAVDPAASSSDLLGIDYTEVPNGTIKYVVPLGIFYYDATSTLLPDGLTVLDTGELVGRWLKYSTGGGSGTGYSLSSSSLVFNTAPLSTLVALPAGSRVDGVTIEVVTAFDGPGANLLIGTPGIPDLYFGVGKSSLSVASRSYHNTYVYTVGAPDALKLTYNAAGSTVGLARIHVRLQLP